LNLCVRAPQRVLNAACVRRATIKAGQRKHPEACLGAEGSRLHRPGGGWGLLAASFVLALTSLWLTGVIEMTALLALAEDGPMRGALGTRSAAPG